MPRCQPGSGSTGVGGESAPADTSGHAASWGVDDPETRAWVDRRLTPHPARTYTDKIALDNPIGNGLPATHVVCDNPLFDALEPARRVARAADWDIQTFPTGHDVMVIAPDDLADRLLEIAGVL